MIPMFRVRASGTCRATVFPKLPDLPLEMAEGLVGLRHLVRVLAPLDSRAKSIHRVDELCGELLAHALAAPLARRLDEPADAQRQAAIAADLDRHLVGRATDAPRLDLDDRRRVAERGLEDLDARPPRRSLGAGECLAQDALREIPLAVRHQLRGEARRLAVGGHGLAFGLPGDGRA